MYVYMCVLPSLQTETHAHAHTHAVHMHAQLHTYMYFNKDPLSQTMQCIT